MTDNLHEELLAQMQSLPSPEGYDANTRYQDFRVLFSSEQGRRVYREIIGWAKIFSPSIQSSPIDPLALAFAEGQRNIVLKLIAAYSVEPPQRPEKATTRRKSNG